MEGDAIVTACEAGGASIRYRKVQRMKVLMSVTMKTYATPRASAFEGVSSTGMPMSSGRKSIRFESTTTIVASELASANGSEVVLPNEHAIATKRYMSLSMPAMRATA